MSFEETLSVEGSEEARALEYSDVGMTSESFDSERTEEGVGRSEMVMVEGDGVRQYESEFRTKDSLGYLVKSYEISSGVLIRPAEVEERACSAPQDHWMPIKGGEVGEGGGDLVNIMYLTSSNVIKAAELYGPSALSEAEMDKFLSAAEGVAIPKKSRKKSRTSTNEASEKRVGKELVHSNSAGVQKVLPRPELKRKGSEELRALQKKKKMVEKEVRGDKVMEFVPQPPPIELDPELKEIEVKEAEAKEEVLRYVGATVVKHTLESASWVNALAQEFVENVKERTLLRSSFLKREKGRSLKASTRVRRKKKKKKMKDAVVKLKKNVELLLHNAIEEHIVDFLRFGTFENIVNLYRLPTAILAFTDCRKKVKSQYPKVDVTSVTFGEQEEKVEENGESMLADFRPKVTLRWDHDVQGHTIFPLNFDFEFVVVEEEVTEVEDI
ncbi:hypothetical protein SLEP1_g22823 [Rubroshorea leprosula]|uniref:Uncharacterized protein n=1 Tax=Rubroshorea leprosula TaxID=152421 RepID=A0AAV5JME7_9ROSI|nr:hypothetical protein SLEP1_g22823 [Rubroshorea leprosula]